MCAVFVFLITFVLLNKDFNIYFYVVEITISLYSFHRICYIKVFEFFELVMSSNIVSYLFCGHMEFFF